MRTVSPPLYLLKSMTCIDIGPQGVESGVCIVMALVATAIGLPHIVGMVNRIRHVLNWIALLNAFAVMLVVIFFIERISSDVPHLLNQCGKKRGDSSTRQLIFTFFWLVNIPWPVVQYIVWNEWYFLPWNFDPNEHERDYE